MIKISEIPNVVNVIPLENYKIKLTYDNGFSGVYDLSSLLNNKVFVSLKNVEEFNKVHKRHNAIVWNDEVDLCGDSIYLKLTGETLGDA